MNEIILPSRDRIRNSSPGGLRQSTLPLGPRLSKQAALTTAPWPPPCIDLEARLPAIEKPMGTPSGLFNQLSSLYLQNTYNG